MKNKKPPGGDFLKWSSIDKALLPALSGVVRTFALTVQIYELIMKVPNFLGNYLQSLQK